MLIERTVCIDESKFLLFRNSNSLHTFHLLEAFNFKLRAWLVIWELDIVLELLVGVLFLYPSALFYSNLRNKSDIVATGGSRPNLSNRDSYWDSKAESRGAG